MSPLFAPVFAQLVGLQLADRTEGRYVKYGQERVEVATRPSAVLSLSKQRTNFSLGYAPALLFLPDQSRRRLLVFHQGSALAAYRLQHTNFSLTSSLSIGDINFRTAGIQGITPTGPAATGTPTGAATPDGSAAGNGAPTGTPTTPSPTTGTPNPNAPSGQLAIKDHLVSYYSSTTSLNAGHQLTRDAQLSAGLVRTLAGGLNAESRLYSPTLSGWAASGTGTYNYHLNARDAFASNLSLTTIWSSNRNRAITLNATETWAHQFSKRAYGALGAGVNITRFYLADGLEGFSIFPSFRAALGHRTQLWRGTLTFSVNGYSTPALDPLRALVDPRIGAGASVDYSRKAFSVGGSAASTFSVAPTDNRAGAVNAGQAEAHAAYTVAQWVQIDGGARYFRQAYQGVAVIPPSWSVFLGLSFAYRVTLASDRAK
jgi:hypothetical protein